MATVSSLGEQETLAQLLSEFTIETSLTNQPDAIKYWIGLKRPESMLHIDVSILSKNVTNYRGEQVDMAK